MSDSMLAGFYAINVKPEHRAAFVDACILEAQSTVSEEAEVFGFHVLMDDANPNRFYVYQVFRDQAALDEYRTTEVFKTWLNAIEPMIDGDVEPVAKMRSLFPTAKGFEAQKPSLLQW